MLKDFRPNLQPVAARKAFTDDDVEELLRKGDLTSAGRLCRRCGISLDRFRPSIERCARGLSFKRQSGIVLSFIYDTGFDVGIDPASLLKNVFDCCDWHGFLKNAHRFKRRRGFETEIDTAIERLVEKKQLADAASWRKKFDALRDIGL